MCTQVSHSCASWPWPWSTGARPCLLSSYWDTLCQDQCERGGEEAPPHLYLFCSSLSLFSYPGLGRLGLKGGPPWEETMEPGQNGSAGMPRCVAGQTDLGHSFTWSMSGPPGRATDFLCLCFISSMILSLFPISNICSSPLFTLRQPHGSSSHSTFPHPWLQL